MVIVELETRHWDEETAPVESTLKTVEEFTWKSMKFPLKGDEGFAPRKVPEADEPMRKDEPRSTRDEVAFSGGRPATESRAHGEVVAIPRRLFVSSKKKLVLS